MNLKITTIITKKPFLKIMHGQNAKISQNVLHLLDNEQKSRFGVKLQSPGK